MEALLPYLPPAIRQAVAALPWAVRAQVEEIRVRAGGHLLLLGCNTDVWVSAKGQPVDRAAALPVTPEMVAHGVELISHSSRYAVEENLRQGYVTLPGGHRVGLAGEVVVVEGPKVLRFRHISALNYRIARAVPGSANTVLPRILAQGRPVHVLVASPPGCGKTTLLRALATQLSGGRPDLGWPGGAVAIIDERGELAGAYEGRPTLDVGPRTDVLTFTPKSEGIRMALRALGPQVIVTDEVGREEDADALFDALGAGVTLLASAHGSNLAELARRPGVGRLIRAGAFDLVVFLSRRNGPGTVEQIERLRAYKPGPSHRHAMCSGT